MFTLGPAMASFCPIGRVGGAWIRPFHGVQLRDSSGVCVYFRDAVFLGASSSCGVTRAARLPSGLCDDTLDEAPGVELLRAQPRDGVRRQWVGGVGPDGERP